MEIIKLLKMTGRISFGLEHLNQITPRLLFVFSLMILSILFYAYTENSIWLLQVLCAPQVGSIRFQNLHEKGEGARILTKQISPSDLTLNANVRLNYTRNAYTRDLSEGQGSNLMRTLPSENTVAIGLGITSLRLTVEAETMETILQNIQFLSTLLPSFCKTANQGFHYHFYLGYDYNDAIFSNMTYQKAFRQQTIRIMNKLCTHEGNTTYDLHMVELGYQGAPARAQNDAMIEAYLDNMEYYYRINDDTILETANWTAAFINTLESYEPSNVGVVGPKFNGGNQAILTYECVHRTHMEIFGFYYPRFYTDWGADSWITMVYLPGRTTKLPFVTIKHTRTLGRRYEVDLSKNSGRQHQIEEAKETLDR